MKAQEGDGSQSEQWISDSILLVMECDRYFTRMGEAVRADRYEDAVESMAVLGDRLEAQLGSVPGGNNPLLESMSEQLVKIWSRCTLLRAMLWLEMAKRHPKDVQQLAEYAHDDYSSVVGAMQRFGPERVLKESDSDLYRELQKVFG